MTGCPIPHVLSVTAGTLVDDQRIPLLPFPLTTSTSTSQASNMAILTSVYRHTSYLRTYIANVTKVTYIKVIAESTELQSVHQGPWQGAFNASFNRAHSLATDLTEATTNMFCP